MNKILLIIRREYFTRVKKKSFIIMTILGPLLMASVMIAPVYFATINEEQKVIGVVDESGYFKDSFEDTKDVKFENLQVDIKEAKKNMDIYNCDIILFIPESAYITTSIILYSKKEPNMMITSYISNTINDDLRTLRMQKAGVSEETLQTLKKSIDVKTSIIKDDGTEEESQALRNYLIGFIGGLVIYFFIFMFGAQVMRGVIEEKTSRIVEVIVSSVKPFQLMMGKIIGVAMVGLTQFILWVLLTLVIVGSAQFAFKDELAKLSKKDMIEMSKNVNSANLDSQIDKSETLKMLQSISSINFPVILGTFLFYFLFGYLMYAALFAAIGGAVDSETDTQQFMLPITVPLILSIAVSQLIANNPDGHIAFWFSIIPLTSPVTMMVRLPFNPPMWEVVLSMVLLIIGFIFTTWIAAKIYRTGILMYGKKITYKELWKWLRYKS